MSLQKLITTVKLCTACIFTVNFSAPAAWQRWSGWPFFETKKTPVQRVGCFSALLSGLTPPTPPPPTIKPRRRRRRWKMLGAPPPPVLRPPNSAADHQFVGAQLYRRTSIYHFSNAAPFLITSFLCSIAIYGSACYANKLSHTCVKIAAVFFQLRYFLSHPMFLA